MEGQKRGESKRPNTFIGVVLAVGFRECSVRPQEISVSIMEYKTCCCFYRSDNKAVLISGERLSQADCLSVAILAVVARLANMILSLGHNTLLSEICSEKRRIKKTLKQLGSYKSESAHWCGSM